MRSTLLSQSTKQEIIILGWRKLCNLDFVFKWRRVLDFAKASCSLSCYPSIFLAGWNRFLQYNIAPSTTRPCAIQTDLELYQHQGSLLLFKVCNVEYATVQLHRISIYYMAYQNMQFLGTCLFTDEHTHDPPVHVATWTNVLVLVTISDPKLDCALWAGIIFDLVRVIWNRMTT